MADVDRVTELWVALAREQHDHQSHLCASENRDSIRSSMAHHVVTETLLVARRHGQVIGFVSFMVEKEGLTLSITRGRIQNLYIEPTERGEGIGTQLLDEAETLLKEKGVEVIAIEAMAENHDARRLYRRRGYEPHRITFERLIAGAGECDSKNDTYSKEDE